MADEKPSISTNTPTSTNNITTNTHGLLPHERYPPDVGPKAWLCVAGSFCGIFVSFGYINVIGVFNAYYLSHQLSTYSTSAVSWISSTETFILIFPGLFIGRLYDMYGPRLLIWTGTLFLLLGVFTTSVAHSYYQIMLAQGICTSIGASLIFNPCVGALSGWFKAKRGLALGIAVSGSSLGGVIMPIMFQRISVLAGFGWAVRSIGFIMTAMALVACFTVSSRIHPSRSLPASHGHISTRTAYISPFSELEFVLMLFAIFFLYWGLFIPIGYIPSHAMAHGFSQSLALYLVAVMNAASVFGRLLPGFLADKLGRFPVFFVACAITAILVLALWLPASGHVPIILFAVFFGFSSGSAISLMPAVIAEISPIREIGTRWGIIAALGSLGALSGMPIAGAIVAHNGGKYWGAAVFAGVSILAGCFFIALTWIVYRRRAEK